tara:strand:- start:353 stop:598 length:246 start_codon:yes stop_codon:yes gene_type:complete
MTMNEFMVKLKEAWYSFIRLFVTHYKLTVSYNHIYGDADDTSYEVKKFYKKQEKYLYFRTVEGELVEIRGAEGLNYRIEEL